MNKNKKTLVILSPGFPTNEEESTCLPSQQLFVRSLNESFPDIEIVILAFQYPFIRSTYQWHQNKVVAFGGKNRGKVYRLATWLRVWLSLRKLRKQNNVIGLFSFWCTECALVGKYFGKYFHIKHYCWISGQDAKLENRFIPIIRPESNELVAMSAFLAREFNKNHKVYPEYIIPNGVVPALFNATLVDRDIDVLGAGSLIALKQYDLFVAIIKGLKQYIPGVKAVICGKGPEEITLKALIKEFHLEPNILLVGEMPHEAVLRFMQRSKILMHTSSYEGFSTVCLEALYAGAHVISFCNPVTEKIKHWNIVNSPDEMLKRAAEILLAKEPDHEPVLAYSMEDSAKAIIKLFDL